MEQPTPPFQEYSARIKEVYVELRDYSFFHSPYSETLKDPRFIGREKVKDRIKSILKYSRTRSGTYLVTGFRGMGKTSVVRQAVAEHNKNRKKKKADGKLVWWKKGSAYIIPFCMACLLWVGVFLAFNFLPDYKTHFAGLFGAVILIGAYSVLIIYHINGNKNFTTVEPLLPYLQLLLFVFLLAGGTWWFLSLEDNYLLIQLVDTYYFVKLIVGLGLSYVAAVLVFLLLDFLAYDLRQKNLKYRRLASSKEGNVSLEYKHFEINLSQDDLKEIDVLKRINKELLDYWRQLDTYCFFPKSRLIYAPWRGLVRIVIRNETRQKRGRTLYRDILRQLQSLNLRISAEVTAQNERNFKPSLSLAGWQGIKLGLQLGKTAALESTAYPIASAKEIEDELIDIFKKINQLQRNDPALHLKGFIFIIDELDKIDPHNNFNLEEREASNPMLDTLNNAPGSNRIRKRQEAVAQLLGNLKGFLNVVEAKFFFIGGREMFDASLADIADRDSFYSSIFNEVIYVNSFFKDKVDDRAGITQMTEAYLCKIILAEMSESTEGESQEDSGYSLKSLYEKLLFEDGIIYIDSPSEADKDNGQINRPSNIHERAQLYKVMVLLQNYVVYLTYRSNGTPKKLASLIEHHIVEGRQEVLNDRSENLVVFQKANQALQNNKQNGRAGLFLRFKFDFQYEIGLTADLYRPYIIANSRHLKSLGDKLLFSSAFIMDHILKFHAFGFSWRNLELIPEVILVNKEPNLRRFIEDLIRFLSHTYIRATVSGIFQYRFYSKTARELMYLSKTSDLGAAAFNFTLDESLQIKRHYKNKLIELRNKYEGYAPVDGDNQFVHSLCFVQTILGDLYFYDKEYDEAVIYYTESIQTIRLPSSIKIERMTRHQLYLWVRNKLKLGLTLEKMRAFNSAFSSYRTLILDLEKCIRTIIDYWAHEDDGDDFQWQAHSHRTVQLLSVPFVAFLGVIEKMRSDGITIFNLQDQEKELDTLLHDLKGQISDHYRSAMIKADYYNNVGSLLFHKNCHFPSMYQSDWEIQGKKLNPQMALEHREWVNEHRADNPVWLIIYDQFRALYKRKGDSQPFDFHPSLSALQYYLKSCAQLLAFHMERLIHCLNKRSGGGWKIKEGMISMLPAFLLPECIDFINTNRFYHLGSITSKLGDAILGSLDKMRLASGEDRKKSFFLLNKKGETGIEAVLSLAKRLNIREREEKPEALSFFNLQQIIDLYELSAAFYRRSGRMYSYAFQYKKILYLIKDFVSLATKEEVKLFFDLFLGENANYARISSKVERIAEEIFRSVTWNYDVSNRPQVLKYRQIFGHDNRREDTGLIYNGLNNSTDCREAILLVEEIKMKLRKLGVADEESVKLNSWFISPYSIINHRFTRILELKFRSEEYYFIFKDMLGMEPLCAKPLEKHPEHIDCIKAAAEKMDASKIRDGMVKIEETSKLNLLIFLISEAIFCLRELIRTVKLYEPGYIVGFSYLGAAHRKMGYWCHAYDNLRMILTYGGGDNAEKDFREAIEKRVGKNAMVYLEPNYHFEMAVQSYYRAIQMHTEGRAYKAYILNLYLLEDDFNDNLTHFSLAMERMRVNTGDVREQIRNTKKVIKGEFAQKKNCQKECNEKSAAANDRGSRLHRYESYYPIAEQESPSSPGKALRKACKEIFDILLGRQEGSKEQV